MKIIEDMQDLTQYIHQNMNKLTYLITEGDETYSMEFITDRTSQWTEQQYMRNRSNIKMNLIGEEPTEETEATSRKI